MPHIKMEMIDAIREANELFNGTLDETQKGKVEEATTLSDLAADLELTAGTQNAVASLYPEVQHVVLHGIKAAVAVDRPVYLSWRHSPIQRVELTAPHPDRGSGMPVDLGIESGYIDDGITPVSTTS